MKQTILFMILFLLLCCLSFHAIYVLIFLAAFHPSIGLVLLLYTMYTCLLENSEVKACPLDVYITLVICVTTFGAV